MEDELADRFLSVRSQIGLRVRAAAERIARRRMFSDLAPEDRDDLVGVAITKFYRRWGTHDQPDNIEAWLTRVMHNALMDFHRDRQLLPRPIAAGSGHSVDELLERWMPPEPSLSTPVVAASEVDAFYSALSPADARLLWLKAQGCSSREIGDLLGIRPNAVDVRLHRLRIRLRELLDPNAEDGPAWGFRHEPVV